MPPKKNNKVTQLEAFKTKQTQISAILSHILSEDERERKVAYAVLASIQISPAHSLHHELVTSRDIIFTLEQALCMPGAYTTQIIDLLWGLVSQHKNTESIISFRRRCV